MHWRSLKNNLKTLQPKLPYFKVPFCNTRATSGFAKCPTDPAMREAWENLCGVKKLKKSDRICHLHFKESDFSKTSKKRWLVNEAIPSLFLPMYDEKQELDEKEDFEPEEDKNRCMYSMNTLYTYSGDHLRINKAPFM